jgi:hypothetical protein
MRHSFIDRYAALDSPLHILEARLLLSAILVLNMALAYAPIGISVSFATLDPAVSMLKCMSWIFSAPSSLSCFNVAGKSDEMI